MSGNKEVLVTSFDQLTDEQAQRLSTNDAHSVLCYLWNHCSTGNRPPAAIPDFLRLRKDAELLIFWNAPLSAWGVKKELESYSLAQWTMRSANLFALACLFLQDDIMEAIVDLFTPDMALSIETIRPNHIANILSSSVLEMAIWATHSLGCAIDPVMEVARCERRLRIIGRLIESGAKPVPMKLLRAGYFPSNGDPMEAAQLSGNQEAAAALLFARSTAETAR